MNSQLSFESLKYKLALAFLGVGLFGCSGSGTPTVHEDMHEDSLEPESLDLVELSSSQLSLGRIEVLESRVLDMQEFLPATGSVAADETRLVNLRPLSRGVVESVFVRRGDRVREGDPLILYDNVELGESIGEYLSRRAQLEKHLAALAVARSFWERGMELLGAQAIARKEVELRKAQFHEARAMVQSQRSEIARTEEKLHRFGLSEEEIHELGNAAAETLHRTASHNTLRAPFDGVIIGYNVAEGELVEPSRELLKLADVSTVWILADVYEKDLGRIRDGQDVEIVSPAYPGRKFPGRLTYVSDTLERETRTARVRCVVANPENLLKLEMFVTVRIPTLNRRRTIAVPESAIQLIDGQAVVFVAEERGRFRRVAVNPGLRSDGWIEVSGLEEKTPVAAGGSFYLKSELKLSEIEPEHGH